MKKDNSISAAKAYSWLGLSYFVVDLAAILLGRAVLTKLYGSTENLSDKVEIIYGFVIRFVIVIPLIYLAIRKLPRFEISKKRLGIKCFFKCTCISFSIGFLGSVFTLVLMNIINKATGIKTVNSIVADISSMSSITLIMLACIMAPIYEELLFRKLLIDRMANYGEVTAMLLSGIMFGLLHGNIYQFFYTTIGGCFFAFVYLRTGKIQYTIGLHMLMNSFSAAARAIISPLERCNKTAAYVCAGVFGVMALVVIVLGVVFMVRDRKRFVFEHHEEEVPSGRKFNTAIINAGMLIYLFFWTGRTVLTMFGTSYTELLKNLL